MRLETFNKSAILLLAAFPDRKFEASVYFELLKDLDDECFLKSVVYVCKTLKELYPGTNLIAILRERTIELKKQKVSNVPRLKQPVPVIEGSLKKMFDDEVKNLAEKKSA